MKEGLHLIPDEEKVSNSNGTTIEQVTESFEKNIAEFTKADTIQVGFGEDPEGHQIMDIRVGYEGEPAKTFSFPVTGPDAMDISDLVMLAGSKEQITGLFGKEQPQDSESDQMFGDSSNSGYDDEDIAA